MKNVKNLGLTLIVALFSASVTLWAYTKFFEKPQLNILGETAPPGLRYASLPSAPQGEAPDLTFAAENSIHAVVHVKVKSQEETAAYGNPLLDWFYGDRYQRSQPQIREGSGSGVIISPDGYIVTNNHVIDGAQQIRVILNDKREFEAKLIGIDENTDVALLKVEANNLPALKFGNSDALKLGEWVLAVGNPFNLTSTVTAGIVSAKGRNIGINPNDMSIESFIQTDAAVNPGNSGGALVNMNGELVGINTAIASLTGSYSGYSFAIPAAIVQKVIADLKQFGVVQRALLGVNIRDVDASIAEKLKLAKIEGVYVGHVTQGGAAEQAGIKTNDIILSINDVPVNSTAELQEQVGKHRPGDNIKVLIKRDDKAKLINVTLRNMRGDTEIVTTNDNEFLGAKFVKVSDNEKYKLRIRQGIKITDLGEGKLKDAGLRKGFIITYVNKQRVNGVNDLIGIVNKANGGILIEGLFPNGERAYFVFSTEER